MTSLRRLTTSQVSVGLSRMCSLSRIFKPDWRCLTCRALSFSCVLAITSTYWPGYLGSPLRCASIGVTYLDTHGFAILHRARSYIPELQSVLMDEDTLLQHKALWVDEAAQHSAAELALLTEEEQQLYRDLKLQRWGQNVRLEQERIDWAAAWSVLQRTLG